MEKAKRWNRLVELVHAHGYLSIKDAAQKLEVSEMTVRRDIEIVEKSGLLRNMKGILFPASNSEDLLLSKKYELSSEMLVQNSAKSALGRYAATMIRPGDCVIFDAGSTVDKIIEYLPQDIEFEALCLSLNTMEKLRHMPKVHLALAGGFYQPATQVFVGEAAISFIRGIRANKMFVSAAGVHEKLGVSCANNYEVAQKRAAMESAGQCILMADSSKFNVVRSAYFCNLADVQAVLTDRKLPAEWEAILQDRNITLHLA